jgi:hypothetical protein
LREGRQDPPISAAELQDRSGARALISIEGQIARGSAVNQGIEIGGIGRLHGPKGRGVQWDWNRSGVPKRSTFNVAMGS